MSRCSAPVACAPLLGVLIVSGLLTAPIIIGRAVSSSVWRNVRPWLSECHATTDSLGNTNAVRILCPPQLQEYAVAAALVVACYVSLAVGFGFAVKSCVAAPGSAKYTKIKNPLSLNNNTASKPISSLSLNREDDQDDNLEIGVKAPILVNRSFLGGGVDDDDLENDLSEIGESRVGGPSEDIRVHGGHVSVSIASVALFRYAVPVCLALLLPASSRTAVVVSCGLAASAVLDVTVQLVVTLVAGKQNSKEDQLGVRRRLLALSFHGLIEGLVSVMDIYLLVELFAKPSSRLIAPSFFTLPLRWCWLMATSALVATQVLGAAAQLRSACGLGAGSSAAIATFGGTWLWHGVPDAKLPGSRAFVLFEFLFRHVALAATRYAWLLAYVGYQLNINEKPFSGTWHPTLLLLCITTAGGLASLIGTVYAWLTIGERMTTPQDSPEQRGWISRYTFWWVFPTLRNAFNRGRVEISDLPSLPHADTPKALFEKFRALWAREETPNLMRLLVYGLQPRLFLFSFLNGWAFLIAMFLDPLILNALLTQSGHQGTSLLLRSLGLVVLLSASMLVRVSCMEVCFFTSTRVMNNSRSALVHAVFRKSLYIAQRDAAQTAGALTNMMATDADAYGKMSGVVFFLAQWTFAMVSLPGVLFFLHRTVGNAAFVGTAAIIVGQFLNLVIMWISKAAVRRVQKKRDERSEAMLELIRNMKMVKLMAWESLWRTKIVAKREEEMEQIVKQRYLRALSGVLSSLILLAIPVSIFGYATMVDKRELDAAIVFTTLAWIAQMQWSINTLPTIFGLYAVMSPSTKRLSDFLGSGDMGWVQDNEQTLSTLPAQLDDAPASPSLKGRASPSFKPTSSPSASPSLRPSPILGPILVRTPVPSPMKTKKSVRANAVRISDATISYGDDVVLKGVNLALEVGELVVVTGEVGSGKSTLLATIANALPVSSGSCQQAGARAYVSQKPFLLNASIRDNVLFGLPMNQADYEKALELSALEPDLHAFQHGDGELVGESGVQLSGGQRSRVALARALYAKADLLVLDDVLSAVDAHTGSYIWEKAITPLVANKTTVVLATHQLQYLARSEVSRVVVLKDRKVFADGPWDQVKTQVGPEFLRFVDENKEDEKKESAKRKNTNERLKDANLNKKEQAGDEETRKTGTIEWNDFRAYLKVFGSWWTVGFLIIFAIAATALTVMSTVWLSIWSDHPGGNVHGLTIYAILGGANALMTGCQTVMLTLCALAAGRALHRMMLQRVLRSKMTLFDTTPAGRIMNRFLQDMASIDQFVPDALLDVTTYTLTMLSQIGLIFAFAPFVALCIPIIGPAYFQIYKRVRIAARDTRRIESVAHSPVYSHFGDTLIGRPVIAAFGAERRFLAHNLALVAEMARAKYSNEATCKWAQALTTQTGSLLYFACGLVAVVLHSKGVVSKAQLGLVMLYAAQLQRSMMEYLMRVTDMETNLVSVERVVQYANLPCEPNFIGASEDDDAATPVSRDKETVPDGWPNGGDIVMKSVDFRYKPELPLVLKNFHLHIPAGSKVAVCGRTGCGKSSMFGVLCRLYSTSNGTVLVDGVDVGQVSLARLRRNVRVVPQDALLSAATVRENLIGNNPDTPNHLVEAALSKVGMLERLLPKGGIQAPVTEAGANFSVGERQLLTLARALLPAQSESKPPRVLLCDEATANVDLESDELVHNALLSLANTTVVMICHRLQHIERFDLVMVLDGGQVGEMGPPKQLLKDENSRLSQLVSDAGL